jgi:hypothetical protein
MVVAHGLKFRHAEILPATAGRRPPRRTQDDRVFSGPFARDGDSDEKFGLDPLGL